MADANAKLEDRVFTYLVLFKTVRSGEQPPLVPFHVFASVGTLYGFDPEVKPALPAVAYALNLPRNTSDVRENSFSDVKTMKSLDLPHDILLAPWPGAEEILAMTSRRPILAIVPDDIADDVRGASFASRLDFGIATFGELSTDRARQHWSLLQARYADTPSPICEAVLDRPYTQIAASQLARLLSVEPPERDANDPDHQREVLSGHFFLETWALLEEWQTRAEEIDARHGEAEETARKTFKVATAISAPGMPRPLRKEVAKASRVPTLAAAGDSGESAALELLATHRALARVGMPLMLPPVPDELFHDLQVLELQYKAKTRRARKVQNQLTTLGRKTAEFLLKHVSSNTLLYSKELLFFSTFPLGLATLPSQSAPLGFVRPVAYRPIVPLTRALQQELLDRPTQYWGDRKLRVTIVECVDPTDKIYPVSIATWEYVRRELSANFDVSLTHANSLATLRQAVNEAESDILIVSSHGGVGPALNQRSLLIGGERFTGTEIDGMPPVVLLSACETSPRGAGTVNVADLLLRHGALAVVCAMVPVDVAHNGVLFVRLLTNVAVAQRGYSGLGTFLDIFNHTLMLNAPLDILHSIGRYPAGRTIDRFRIQFEFMSNRSRGRLRAAHVNEDGLSVLREVARDYGAEPTFSHLLSSAGYFPESAFYMVLGWPEKIRVYDPDYAKLLAAAREKG